MSRVVEVRRERVDVVRERALLAQLEEEPARHPLPEDRVEHVEGVLVGVLARDAAPADAHVGLLGASADQLRPQLARRRRALELRHGTRLHTREERLDRLEYLGRDDVPGHGDDDARRYVAAAHEVAELVRVERVHDRLASRDLPAERVLRVQELVDHRVHAVLRLIAVHPQLFDDDALFRVDILGSQHRRADEVGDDVERDAPVPSGHARPEHRDLFVRRRVHHAAAALDLHADVRRGRPFRRALEDDVLEEVTGPGVRTRLHARARADEDGERCRAGLGHLGDEDANAVREDAFLVIHREEL